MSTAMPVALYSPVSAAPDRLPAWRHPCIEEVQMSSTGRYRDTEIRAPRGTQLNAKSWLTEAPLRMLMNNLDPE
ncbi:hypothetical protein, partial [Pseudomonas nitroreducens]|uniref:hypothetical protein n=1 Tax=Pseudomonas nitroreducens TaxID=46680 RepID=UPI0028A58E88